MKLLSRKMPAGICKTCRYWHPKERETDHVAQCHRYPPFNDEADYPISDRYEWCEEYKKAKRRRRKK